MAKREIKESLDRELEAVRLSEERKAAILAAMEEEKGAVPVKEKKQMFRMVILAAAMCVLLSAAALAASPSLRAALSAALAGFEPYSQEIQDVSDEDQGIEVRVVRTLADETGGTVYLEVTDQTGHRLTEKSMLEDAGMCLAYEKENDTALFAQKLDERDVAAEQQTLTYSCLLPSVQSVDGITLPWDLLTAERLKTKTLTAEECEPSDMGEPEEANTVLEPEQTPADLDTDLLRLSSMGFDEAGEFHLQLAFSEGVGIIPGTDLYTTCPEISWQNMLSINERHTVFVQNGVRYFDLCMPALTDQYFGSFSIKGLLGKIVVGTPVRGEWTLQFPLQKVPQREIALSGDLNGQILKSVTISATRVRKYAASADSSQRTVLGYPLSVYLDDGTVMTIPYDSAGRSADTDGEEIIWEFPYAIDPAQVEGIAIGAWYIPIHEDNTAGPGRWLNEAP